VAEVASLPRSVIALWCTVWSAVMLLFAAHTFWAYDASGRPIPFAQALSWSVTEWCTWAIFTPLVIAIARRLEGTPRSRLAWHGPAAIVLAALQALLAWVVDQGLLVLSRSSLAAWLSEGRLVAAGPAFFVQRKLGFGIAVYATTALAAHALALGRREHQRREANARLEAELVQARLALLRSQLQPHFLFNALNDAGALVRSDPAAAERLLADLGDLLRAALRAAETSQITLREELELGRAYLEVQRVRFAGLLRYDVDVDDALADVPVPPLLLQPLLENAVLHGRGAQGGAVRVDVRCRREDGEAVIEVADDGEGLQAPAHRAGSGFGLRASRGRLQALHGLAATLELRPRDGGGTVARISLPVRP
jgi:hypothetical protein